MPDDDTEKSADTNIDTLAGNVEVLKSQIISLQESESKSVGYLKYVVLIFAGVSIFGSFKLNDLVNETTKQTFALINDTKEEIRYLTDRSRPSHVQVTRIESGDPTKLPGFLSITYLPKNDNYKLKLAFRR